MTREARVLVTGGAGFIGSHLVESLIADGLAVTVLDDLSTGRLENLRNVEEGIHFQHGDVRDPDALRLALLGVETVFHLAANTSVPASVDQPTHDFEVNALGAQRMLLASRVAGVQRIVLGSSAAVYGNPARIPTQETDPAMPISPYGASKLAAEVVALAYRHVYGLNTVICRIFNIYGPRQRCYVMHDFFRKLRSSPRELRVLGDGTQIRDYCYVSDAVRALRLVAMHGEGVYNIAGGQPIAIREVAERIVSLTSPEARIVYGEPTWKGDIPVLHADITRIKNLGFEPDVDLASGMRAFLEEQRRGQ